MSHILDALQKLQEEKTAHLKQSAITGGILLDAGAPRRRRPKRYLLAGMVAAVILIGGLAFWITRPPNQQAQPKTPPQTVQPAVAPQQPLAVVTPPPPVAAQPPQTAPPAPPAVQPLAPTVPAQPSLDEEEEDRSTRRTKRTATPTPPQASPATPVTVGTPEGIKLSGIAWHDNHKLRRAVVNDLLVAEGAEVGGARIVQIRTNLVKIEKNGMLYEVVLPH